MKSTNDADLLICCMYKEYLSRRKSSISKDKASYFDGKIQSVSTKISSWSDEDISETLLELEELNFVKSDISGSVRIKKDAIIYMENRFKNGIIDVTDFISKFIP